MRREIVEHCDGLGLLIHPTALDRLAVMEDPCRAITRLRETGAVSGGFITCDCLNALVTGVGRCDARGTTPESVASEGDAPRPPLLTPQDVRLSPGEVRGATDPIASLPGGRADAASAPDGQGPSVPAMVDDDSGYLIQGEPLEFHNQVMDRFVKVSRLFQGRNGTDALVADPSPETEGEFSFACLVRSHRKSTKSDNVIYQVETPTRVVSVLVNPAKVRDSGRLIDDDVVVLRGSYGRKKQNVSKRFNDSPLFFANEIIWPSLPTMNFAKLWDEEAYVAFVGDIHAGSKNFLGKEWTSFVVWLNSDDPVASKVRHLVVVGDLVDGVGIYPNQQDELALDTYDAQYALLSELLEDIPPRIELHIIPGNHDMVPISEPQPPLSKATQALINRKADYLPNPAWINLDGFRILAYHGSSIMDMISQVPGIKMDRPLEAMREMLDRRSLAPYFGGKTPLLPVGRDHHVIDAIPNVLVTGHIHTCAAQIFRGIILINASTWQSQTGYQKAQNFKPDPAKVVLVNLKNGRTCVKSFMEEPAASRPGCAPSPEAS